MTRFFDDAPATLESLAALFENLLFPLLLIEIYATTAAGPPGYGASGNRPVGNPPRPRAPRSR